LARLDLLNRKQTAAKVYAAGGEPVRASQLCCSGLHSEVGNGLNNERHSAASKDVTVYDKCTFFALARAFVFGAENS
jgi:hypothetical protein